MTNTNDIDRTLRRLRAELPPSNEQEYRITCMVGTEDLKETIDLIEQQQRDKDYLIAYKEELQADITAMVKQIALQENRIAELEAALKEIYTSPVDYTNPEELVRKIRNVYIAALEEK